MKNAKDHNIGEAIEQNSPNSNLVSIQHSQSSKTIGKKHKKKKPKTSRVHKEPLPILPSMSTKFKLNRITLNPLALPYSTIQKELEKGQPLP